MKRLFVLLSVPVFSAQVFAADWRYLSDDETMTIYYDTATVVRHRSTARLWELTDFKAAQVVGTSVYLSTMNLWEYNCSERLINLLTGSAYSENMGMGVVVFTANYKTKDWAHVPPGSHSEEGLRIACGK